MIFDGVSRIFQDFSGLFMIFDGVSWFFKIIFNDFWWSFNYLIWLYCWWWLLIVDSCWRLMVIILYDSSFSWSVRYCSLSSTMNSSSFIVSWLLSPQIAASSYKGSYFQKGACRRSFPWRVLLCRVLFRVPSLITVPRHRSDQSLGDHRASTRTGHPVPSMGLPGFGGGNSLVNYLEV